MEDRLKPTLTEVQNWLISTLRHSCMVEYYLQRFNLGRDDPQRPHDLSGEGSKYCWPVMRGLAIQNRQEGQDFFDHYVLPAVEFHRQHQFHHQMWNRQNPTATQDAMRVGAVDAICSLLDDRKYQGGTHTFEQIEEIIRQNKSYQVKWFWMVYSRMKRLPLPEVAAIESVREFPNIGIVPEMYSRTVELTKQAARMLQENGYEL